MIHRGTPFTLQEMAQGVSTSDFHMTPGNGKGNDMETKCGKTVHSVCVKVHLRVERTEGPTDKQARIFVRLSVVPARGVHPMGERPRCFTEN